MAGSLSQYTGGKQTLSNTSVHETIEQLQKSVLKSLLEECYDLFNEMEDNGWIIRGGRSRVIQELMGRMRPLVYELAPLKLITQTQISFACTTEGCPCDLSVVRLGSMAHSYASTECAQCHGRYKLTWGHDEVLPFVERVKAA